MIRFYVPITLLLLSLTGVPRPANARPETIVPGAVWNDTAGNLIQAHGGGMIQVGKTYYWFGEDHTAGRDYKSVPCYASTDLVHWVSRGDALSGKGTTIPDLGPNRVLERPKVLYNAPTHTYVMYMHIDSGNYREAKVGVATCPTVDGTYTYRGSFRPLEHQSRDMSLFEDADGKGYLLFEDRASGVRIEQLTTDFLGVAGEVALIPKSYEGLAVIHTGGLYYLLGSRLSGWAANANQYATAPSLAGPWSDWKQLAPPATKTYDSQTAFVLTITGTKATTYMYGGDRWNNGRDLQNARYIWMPLELHYGALRLPPDDPWTIDTTTGLSAYLPTRPTIAPGDYQATSRAGGPAVAWRLALVPNRSLYTIADPATGNLLDVAGAAIKPGAPVTLFAPNGNANQLWRIAPVRDGFYTLTNRNSGLRLTSTPGGLVQQSPSAGPEQQWKLAR
jgi:hypothetical protein